MFVRTKEFVENVENMRRLLKYMMKPKNFIITLFNLVLFLGFYCGLLIIADTLKGAL